MGHSALLLMARLRNLQRRSHEPRAGQQPTLDRQSDLFAVTVMLWEMLRDAGQLVSHGSILAPTFSDRSLIASGRSFYLCASCFHARTVNASS